MEPSDRVEKEAREARARWGGDKYMPWETLPGTTRDEWLAAIRPLVERIAELEDDMVPEGLGRLRAALSAGRDDGTLEAAERVVRTLATTRDELTIERQARRTAVELASSQTKRINALEVRAAEAEEQARATAQKLYEERAEVSNLRGMLETRDMLLRAADRETERQTAYGAKLAERFEEVESRLAGMTGERDEALTMMRRYSVSLADQIAANRRLRHELRDAESGLRAALRMAERPAGERAS